MLWAVEKQWVFYIMGWASIFLMGLREIMGFLLKTIGF